MKLENTLTREAQITLVPQLVPILALWVLVEISVKVIPAGITWTKIAIEIQRVKESLNAATCDPQLGRIQTSKETLMDIGRK